VHKKVSADEAAATHRRLSLLLLLFSSQAGGIFVVPRSDQCYPEYLITFQ